MIDVLSEALHQNTVDARLLRKLRTRVIWLDDTELMIQRQLDLLESQALPDRINHEKFKRDLFDIEIAAEELVSAGMASTYDEMTPLSCVMLLGALETLRSALRKDHPLASLQSTVDAATKLASALLRLRTQAEISNVSLPISNPDWAPAPLSNRQPVLAGRASMRDERPQQRLPFWERISPPAKQALQVLIAASMAAFIGNLLSTHRLYWAVMAAYVAISGTNSRIESLNKGIQRAFGALLGIIVGTLVATLVGGNPIISIILMIVCLFMMMYWAPVNYSIMVIFITTLLSLLYGMLGEFSIQLLTLRLEETVLGVLIGSLAALFILPVYTGRTVRAGMQQFLTDLEQIVGSATAHLVHEPMPASSLIAQVQGLKPQLQLLRQRALPLTSGLLAGGSHDIQRSILVFMSCEHHARSLVRAVNQINTMSLNPAMLTTLAQLVEQISTNIDELKATLDNHRPASIESVERQLETFEDTVLHSTDRSNQQLLQAIHALRQIDQAVVRLTCDNLGVPRAADDPLNKLVRV
ncbi:FUSC family protein [Dictyobacter arantiisoli]|uniref:Integral membrane bound transporter domain-containing protein n=1 Tax=Dictyobacter arantiisoli TaxID=2014874 RepID=A0A5A5TE80_9CHLR|nr:FUSC family protein [Dictyobacter arantiisoli]GCF09545.1 hypothetical protein KDI_31090 [Dictyobacter arantiisoli]